MKSPIPNLVNLLSFVFLFNLTACGGSEYFSDEFSSDSTGNSTSGIFTREETPTGPPPTGDIVLNDCLDGSFRGSEICGSLIHDRASEYAASSDDIEVTNHLIFAEEDGARGGSAPPPSASLRLSKQNCSGVGKS